MRNTAGKIDPATRHEDERHVSGDAPEIGAEQREGFLSLRIRSAKTMCGDIRRIGEARRDAIRSTNGAVEIDEASAAENLLARNAALNCFEMRKNLRSINYLAMI